MTYRGRPSTACPACRARRIKCDNAKPMCTQCVRMHIICPGYCDPLDQKFRDESERVAKRAQKSYSRLNNGRACTKSLNQQSNNPHPMVESVVKVTAIPLCDNKTTSGQMLQPSLSYPVEDIAVAYFMSCFVPGSRFDYLPGIYSQYGTSSAMHAVIRAVSIASLAQGVEQMVPRRYYAEALTATNTALSDPSLATTDATLISILLLSLFEAMSWTSPQIAGSWKTHTHGALALIKLRGSEQLKTPVGQKLFLQVTNMICVNSVQEKTRLPAEMVALLHLARHYDGKMSKYDFAFLMCEVSSLMAAIDEGSMTAQQAFDASQNLDEQSLSFAASLALQMPYRTIPLEEYRPEVYGMSYHEYDNHREAQVWNSIRMIRILLNETIYAHADCIPAYLAPSIRAKALHNINQMNVDICASVSQFADTQSRPTSPDSLELAKSGSPILLRASTASLLLPLSVVSGAEFSTKTVRTYAMERLKVLGRELPVPQAEKVAMQNRKFEALQDRLFMFYAS